MKLSLTVITISTLFQSTLGFAPVASFGLSTATTTAPTTTAVFSEPDDDEDEYEDDIEEDINMSQNDSPVINA